MTLRQAQGQTECKLKIPHVFAISALFDISGNLAGAVSPYPTICRLAHRLRHTVKPADKARIRGCENRIYADPQSTSDIDTDAGYEGSLIKQAGGTAYTL